MPVLRNVETMNYADIELGIADLGEKVCECVFQALFAIFIGTTNLCKQGVSNLCIIQYLQLRQACLFEHYKKRLQPAIFLSLPPSISPPPPPHHGGYHPPCYRHVTGPFTLRTWMVAPSPSAMAECLAPSTALPSSTPLSQPFWACTQPTRDQWQLMERSV